MIFLSMCNLISFHYYNQLIHRAYNPPTRPVSNINSIFFFTFVRASLLIVYTTSKTHRINNIYSQSVIHEYFPTLLQNVLHIDTWIRLLFMVLITWAYFLLLLKWLFIIHFLFLKLLRMVKKTGTYMNILLLSFIYLFIYFMLSSYFRISSSNCSCTCTSPQHYLKWKIRQV